MKPGETAAAVLSVNWREAEGGYQRYDYEKNPVYLCFCHIRNTVCINFFAIFVFLTLSFVFP